LVVVQEAVTQQIFVQVQVAVEMPLVARTAVLAVLVLRLQ
jgi:hypothetical protein